MSNRLVFILLIGLFFVGQAFVSEAAEPQVTATRPGANVTVERQITDTKVLMSVRDSVGKPLFGLTAGDFVVTAGKRTANIIAVQPISESLDVPRNIVMVLDNSSSMRQRNAVEPLKAGVDELIKTVRPIDKVKIVTFGDKGKTNLGGRDLRVQTFSSSQPAELNKFVAEAYGDGMTSRTMLYDAMLVGLELVRAMPKDEPRFMVVFSDGEDINSSYSKDDVLKATELAKGFSAYAIDYMPEAGVNPFLRQFAEGNQGEVWKAESESNFVQIFQSVASKMQYYYILSYLFPTTGSLSVAPMALTIDEIENFDASQPAGALLVSRIDSPTLTLKPSVDSVYGIARWKATLANRNGTLVEQSGEGAPGAEISIPLKKEDLGRLAAGGDISATVEVRDRKDQTVQLSAQPVKVDRNRTSGSLTVAPTGLTIEEIKTIDSSPMLGYIYFAEGSSEIPAHYVRLAGAGDAAVFDEQRFRDALEKYHQVLNIIGKRLASRPKATITIVGCNSDTSVEKNKKKLSAERAEAVRDYLQTVWSIAPERMKTEARNLPAKPSTRNLKEGQAENRRVEIQSADLEILGPIRSTYFATKIDAAALTLHPVVNAAHGVERWRVSATNSKGILGEVAGEGAPPAEVKVSLNTDNLNEMAAAGDIKVSMTAEDRKKQELAMTAAPVKVNFIKTSQRLAEKQDVRVQEKYALILFDFDSDAISGGNQEIVNGIISRIKELPDAKTEIVGHTDNIGKESYNIKLSERRALAVYKLLAAAYGEDSGDRLRHRGVGPDEPLYDNMTPEARAFNRTVTITLEYMTNK
jgi:outer membrane protein OmpA-like peptidoglycan-associated protein/Mg-chelatase subunit ChlD